MRIVCVDIGTSSVKTELVEATRDVGSGPSVAGAQEAGAAATGRSEAESETGYRVLARAERPLHTEHPGAGHVTQDAQEWFAATKACIAELRDALIPEPGEPWCNAVALTGQMQDVVLLDAQQRPTVPVILYSDVRAEREYDRILTQLTWDMWYDRLPNVPDADCIPAKLWHLDAIDRDIYEEGIPHELELAEAMVFSAPGAVAAALTGQYVCDRLTASTTSLYDCTTGDWFELSFFIAHHVPPMLPRIVEPGVVGPVKASVAADWGLPADTPVVMGMGDAGATSDGTLAVSSARAGDSSRGNGGNRGGVYLYLGTSGWVAYLDPRPLTSDKREGYFRLAHPHGTLNIAALANAGSALRWGRAVLLGCDGRRGPDPESAEALRTAEAELARALRGKRWADVAANPAFGGERLAALGSSGARGSFSNLSYQHEACDLYAGLVGGVAHNIAQLLDSLGVEQSSAPLPVTGGVLRSPGVRRTFEQVLGRDVELVDVGNASLRHCAKVAVESLLPR